MNGSPVVEQISRSELRITGITLDPEAAMTVDLPGTASADAPDILLPDSFAVPQVSFAGEKVSAAALVKVDVISAGTGPFTNLPLSVEKTERGTGLRIRLTNTKVGERTQSLEIYLTLLGTTAGQGTCEQISIVDSPGAQVSVPA